VASGILGAGLLAACASESSHVDPSTTERQPTTSTVAPTTTTGAPTTIATTFPTGVSADACSTLVDLFDTITPETPRADVAAGFDTAWDQAMEDGDTDLANLITLAKGTILHTPGLVDQFEQQAADLGAHCAAR
jgi:hypothetical protein